MTGGEGEGGGREREKFGFVFVDRGIGSGVVYFLSLPSALHSAALHYTHYDEYSHQYPYPDKRTRYIISHAARKGNGRGMKSCACSGNRFYILQGKAKCRHHPGAADKIGIGEEPQAHIAP